MTSVKKNKKRGTRIGGETPRSRDRPAVAKCDPQCARYAACRPNSPGWVPKKQVAANVGTTLAALRVRARRVGYVSPARTAMPRRDQPKLCLDAAYFAQLRRRK
jgi:hypothetical protein